MTTGQRPWYSAVATLLFVIGTLVASRMLADLDVFWLVRWVLSAAAGLVLAIVFVFVAGAITPDRPRTDS